MLAVAQLLEAFSTGRRPTPERESWAWTAVAACRGMDPATFFPRRGAPTREAKAVCARCPVKAECLRSSLEEGERFGIWGGFSERERRRLRRRLNDGADIEAVVEESVRQGCAA